jgi:hypothetical protein
MPGIIEFPQVVRDAVERFGDVFANEPQRRHFAEYLTGLMIAERKSVLGINREFAHTTDQSCLNKYLTEADWDANTLNEKRLAWLQQRYTDSEDGRGARHQPLAGAASDATDGAGGDLPQAASLAERRGASN